MNIEFKKAIEKKKIIKFLKGKKLIKRELKVAKDDLSETKDRFKNKRYKYATITAYYSMFYSARALLFAKGYREKSHYWLIVALQALYVEKGLIGESLVSDFHDAMILREDADYHGKFSKEGAEVTIESAKIFLKKAKSILSRNKN